MIFDLATGLIQELFRVNRRITPTFVIIAQQACILSILNIAHNIIDR